MKSDQPETPHTPIPQTIEQAKQQLEMVIADYQDASDVDEVPLPAHDTLVQIAIDHLIDVVQADAVNSHALLVEQVETLKKQRDEYRTLAGVGTWHKDCRPNRQQAAREIEKSQAVINKLADTITALEYQQASLVEALSAIVAFDPKQGPMHQGTKENYEWYGRSPEVWEAARAALQQHAEAK